MCDARFDKSIATASPVYFILLRFQEESVRSHRISPGTSEQLNLVGNSESSRTRIFTLNANYRSCGTVRFQSSEITTGNISPTENSFRVIHPSNSKVFPSKYSAVYGVGVNDIRWSSLARERMN